MVRFCEGRDFQPSGQTTDPRDVGLQDVGCARCEVVLKLPPAFQRSSDRYRDLELIAQAGMGPDVIATDRVG